jgi:hypothetical protein
VIIGSAWSPCAEYLVELARSGAMNRFESLGTLSGQAKTQQNQCRILHNEDQDAQGTWRFYEHLPMMFLHPLLERFTMLIRCSEHKDTIITRQPPASLREPPLFIALCVSKRIVEILD